MKRLTKIILSLILALLITLSFSSESYAIIQGSVPEGIIIYEDDSDYLEWMFHEEGDRVYVYTENNASFQYSIDLQTIAYGSMNYFAVASSKHTTVVLEINGQRKLEASPAEFDLSMTSMTSLEVSTPQGTYEWLYSEADDAKLYFEGVDYKPVLDGETAFVTNVDNPISETEIRSYITAWDETDGDLTHLIQLDTDDYTRNNTLIGSWPIIYSVSDSAGNVATLTVHVLVRDVTAPTWNNFNEASVSYTQTFNIEAYKSNLGATDNYDASQDLSITVKSNTYTANKTIPGEYQVTYEIQDTSGNKTEAIINVTVFDNVAPTISGPESISKPSTSVLTLSSIKSQLTANDAIDGNLTSQIQVVFDDYTGNGHRVGSYDIEFEVFDTSGNGTTHLVTINVFDDLPPIYWVRDNYFITVDQSVSLTLEQIIDILEITGQITSTGSGGVQVMSILNEYEGNESEPGIYAMSFRAVTLSGNESVHHVAIQVVESENEDPILIDEEEPWYQEVLDFLDVVWSWIKDNVLLSIGIGIGVVGFTLILISASNSKARNKNFMYQRRR